MMCASDNEDLTLTGNYDSEEASNLMIVFEKCDPYKTPNILCANDRDIEAWLSAKRILTVDN